jgi:hypothetical protein
MTINAADARALDAMEQTRSALNSVDLGDGQGNQDVQKAGEVITQIGAGVALVNPIAGGVVSLVGAVVGMFGKASG